MSPWDKADLAPPGALASLGDQLVPSAAFDSQPCAQASRSAHRAFCWAAGRVRADPAGHAVPLRLLLATEPQFPRPEPTLPAHQTAITEWAWCLDSPHLAHPWQVAMAKGLWGGMWGPHTPLCYVASAEQPTSHSPCGFILEIRVSKGVLQGTLSAKCRMKLG